MATLKHINSKNADYGAAEQYLLFEHDEFTTIYWSRRNSISIYWLKTKAEFEHHTFI